MDDLVTLKEFTDLISCQKSSRCPWIKAWVEIKGSFGHFLTNSREWEEEQLNFPNLELANSFVIDFLFKLTLKHSYQRSTLKQRRETKEESIVTCVNLEP